MRITRRYTCTYEDVVWSSEMEEIRRTNDYIELEIQGNGTMTYAVIGRSHNTNWIMFPNLDKGASLSYLGDSFWNNEKLVDILEDPLRATTITQALKIISNETK